MRILIAEDDFTSRKILAAVLKQAGHEVTETVDGAQAWVELQKPDAPRLAVLDWMMPEADGLEVVRRVRALPTDQPIYLIMLTSKGQKADIVTALEVGADDYLSKPFDVSELRARVEVGRRLVETQEALIESRKALAYQADHDSLTGLLNHKAVLTRLQEELLRASRQGGFLTVGILDIDHFKMVNDTYGHQTGDDALCELSRIITGCLRMYDTVGRLGGEEFLIIVPMTVPKNSDTDAQHHFDRIRSSIADTRIMTRSGPLSVTVSIGATIANGASTVDDLLAVADAALYRAKSEGRNCVMHSDISM